MNYGAKLRSSTDAPVAGAGLGANGIELREGMAGTRMTRAKSILGVTAGTVLAAALFLLLAAPANANEPPTAQRK